MNLIASIIPVDDMNLVAESCAWCCVQVTLFTAAVAGVYGLTCRQRASRNVFLLSGGLAVVGLLTMASVSPWPRWNVNLPSVIGEREVNSPPAVGISALPMKDRMVPAPSDLMSNVDEHVADGEATQGGTAIAAAADPLPAPVEATFSWRFGVVLAAWVAALFGLARLVVGLAYIRRHCRKSAPIDDADTRKAFDELRGRLGVTSPVELCESPSLEVAATIGWRRPVILLPPTWRAWSPDQRRAVLAHELAHVAERHVPLWLVSQVATVPHFYHPLVHWLGRRLRLEQEIAADQLAARLFGSRRRYCAALASLALGPTRPTGPIAAIGLFMSRPLLMRRIAMLRKPIKRIRRPSRFGYLVGLALIAMAAVGVAGLRADSPANNELDDPPYTAAEDDTATPAVDVDTDNSTAATNDVPALQSAPSPGSPTRASSDVAASNKREVVALLQVSSESEKLFGRTDGEQSWRVYSRTQAALLGSKLALQTALTKPEIAALPLVAAQQDPMDWARRRLLVGFIPDSEIMYVRIEGTRDEVEQLRKLIDAVVSTYMDKFVHGEQQRRRVLRDALATSLLRINREISDKMESRNELAKELGVTQAYQQQDPESQIMIRQVSEAAKTKGQLEAKLADMEANFYVMRQQLKDPAMIDAMVDEQLANDPQMSALNSQLLEYQHQLSLPNSETENRRSREAARLKQQIAAIQQQISQYRAQMKRQMVGAKKGQPNPQLQALTKEYEIRTRLLTRQIQELDTSINFLTEDLMKKSEKSVDLDIKTAELAQLQEIANDMSIRLEMMDIEAVIPAERVRVIHWAM